MSEQMMQIVGNAIARAYESGELHERSKTLIIIDALLADAEKRLNSIQRSPSSLMEKHQTRTEIRIYTELKERIRDKA